MTRIDHAARSRSRMEKTLSSYEMGEDAGAIVDPCPRCGHTTHPTHVVGRFLPRPEFRPSYHFAPTTYLTRAEAERDQCDWQARRPLEGQEPLL